MSNARDPSPPSLTTTSYAVLAQLAVHPWSTYELARQRVRYFPVRSSHPRAHASACAAEAAALQGRFWAMHDALFADQGRLEDPHLWARAERLGLDVARFDADRRSEAVAARVREHFQGGVRAGVVTTPTMFVGGQRHAGRAALG